MLERHTVVPKSWVMLWRDPGRSLDEPSAVGDVAGDRVVPTEEDLVDLLEDLGVEWLDNASTADAIQQYFSFSEPQVRTRRKIDQDNQIAKWTGGCATARGEPKGNSVWHRLMPLMGSWHDGRRVAGEAATRPGGFLQAGCVVSVGLSCLGFVPSSTTGQLGGDRAAHLVRRRHHGQGRGEPRTPDG